jgi:RNA polymerase sigma-54 factor
MRHLVGCLDDRGFLTQTPPDIALQTGLPLAAVQTALEVPAEPSSRPASAPGTSPDCLLGQLAAKGRGMSLAPDHSRSFRSPDPAPHSRTRPQGGRGPGDVQSAIEEIGKLDPAPGRRFAEDNNRVVIPDVTVEKDGDEWKIHLNSDYIPRLRISSTYRDMIARARFPRTSATTCASGCGPASF